VSVLAEQGTDVLFVTEGPERGLYLNGHKVNSVVAIEPELFERNSVAEVKITLAVSRFRVQKARDA